MADEIADLILSSPRLHLIAVAPCEKWRQFRIIDAVVVNYVFRYNRLVGEIARTGRQPLRTAARNIRF